MKEKIFVKMLLFTILATYISSIYVYGQKNYQPPNKVDYNIADFPLAEEYSLYADFDINLLPDDMFYKLNVNCKYYIKNQKDVLKIIKNDNEEMIIKYNESVLDLSDIGSGSKYASNDTNIYLIKKNNNCYLLLDRIHFRDTKYYNLYLLARGKIELAEENYGRIDFVGYDYIIGYLDLETIGYQRCEFKKVFRNGKFELDGEYTVIGNDNSNSEYLVWKIYTLAKDLEFDEYDDKTKTYNSKLLKRGTNIRILSTDSKEYIKIEVKDGRKGIIKIEKIDGEFERNFIVNS